MDRRNFLKSAGAAAAISGVGQNFELLAAPAGQAAPASKNDYLQIALIGAGGQGQGDTHVALQVPGTKLVAVADCYQGRLDHSKEVWGSDIFTTKDYREILARKDIDAVIIATPDHWHKQAIVDSLKAGKDAYCEKPMIHEYSDGPEIIAAEQSTKRILQIGSQRVSSVIYAKAKELLDSGAIGKLNMIQAHWDRNSSIGAWNYTVPLDASTETCDWNRFLGTAPKIPFNAEHFFQWRKWKAYGSGVAGDLFVHLFSGAHFITGSKGPTLGMATAGIRFWKDGRNAPDVMLALFDYPEGFNLNLRVNFVDGGDENEGLTFTGSEGTIDIVGNSVILNHVPREQDPGLSINTFTNAMQRQILAQHGRPYPPNQYQSAPVAPPANETLALGNMQRFVAPRGYNDSYDHFRNFFDSVRTRKPVVEDAQFGFRAAGAALLSNISYEKQTTVHWDPVKMKLG